MVEAPTVDPIGKVTPAIHLWETPAVDASGNLPGIIGFFSLILRILFVVAGLWVFFNFIIAGFGYISAGGDSKKVEVAWTKIWQSVLGLVIIMASFLVAAVIGLILFGDPRAILFPQIPK